MARLAIDPELFRVPSEEAWRRICEIMHGASRSEVDAIARSLDHWPHEMRRVSGTVEREDLWWAEGYEPEDQPWLALVRTLYVGIEELLDVDSPSAWERFGFPAIKRLVLTSAWKPKFAPRAFARLPNVDELNLQRVRDERRNREQVIAVAPPLRVLEGRNGALGRRGLAAVMRHGISLERLDLRQNDLQAPGFRVLAQWPSPSRLRELLVSGNGIRVSALSTLSHSPILDRLTTLDIGGLVGQGATFEWLIAPQLECLCLSGSVLGGSEIQSLVRDAEVPSLRRLGLAGAVCDRKGLGVLLESGWLEHLRSVDLSHNRLDSAAVDLLLHQPVGELMELRVNDTGLDAADLNRLEAWLGHPVVVS